MKYKILWLLCLSASLYIKGQDTICKRTGECFAAKVLEIGITDVKFKRADNLDGPLFIYNKNDIKKIKYASGAIDTFALVKENPKSVYSKKGLNALDFNRVEPSGRACVFIYHGRSLSDRQLVKMSLERNVTWRDTEMAYEIKKTKESKALQYITGFSGIGLGLITLGVVSNASSTTTGTNPGVLGGGLLIGTGLVIASQVLSFHFKLQRGAHAKKVAALYNAHLH